MAESYRRAGWRAETSSKELLVHGFVILYYLFYIHFLILVSCAQPGGQTEGHVEREQRQGRRMEKEGRGGAGGGGRGSEQYVSWFLSDSFSKWKRSRLRGRGDATQVLCPADWADHPPPPLPIRLWGSPLLVVDGAQLRLQLWWTTWSPPRFHPISPAALGVTGSSLGPRKDFTPPLPWCLWSCWPV